MHDILIVSLSPFFKYFWENTCTNITRSHAVRESVQANTF